MAKKKSAPKRKRSTKAAKKKPAAKKPNDTATDAMAAFLSLGAESVGHEILAAGRDLIQKAVEKADAETYIKVVKTLADIAKQTIESQPRTGEEQRVAGSTTQPAAKSPVLSDARTQQLDEIAKQFSSKLPAGDDD